jgi:hypothetical protein
MRTNADRTTNLEIQRDDIAFKPPRLRKVSSEIHDAENPSQSSWLVHHNAVFAGAHLLSRAVFIEVPSVRIPILPWTGTRKSQDHTSRKCEDPGERPGHLR